jgi:hypothetical protein
MPTPNQGNIMSDNPIVVDIKPAKRRFGRTPRKQWQFRITGSNGEPLDPRETYANVGDVTAALLALRHRAVTVRVHYAEGVQEMHWAAS